MELRRSDLAIGIGGGIAMGIAVATVLVFFSITLFEALSDRSRIRRLAAQEASRTTWIAPDLHKRYDLTLSDRYGKLLHFPDCLLLGKAGEDPGADSSIAAIVEGRLALQTKDGRMVYVDSSRLLVLEESRIDKH